MKKISIILFVFFLSFASATVMKSSTGNAAHCCPTCSCSACCSNVGRSSKGCTCVSTNETGTVGDSSTTLGHITKEFFDHKTWMVETFIRDRNEGNSLGVIAALQLMTTELTTVGMQYVHAVGLFFDAKHQLEIQNLFQVLTAKAHKDYHPSEGVCDFGSSIKSLSSSSRLTIPTQISLSKRALDRQTLARDTLAYDGEESDKNLRLISFIKDFCNTSDNGGNLSLLCTKSENQRLLFNRDIDFSKTLAGTLTLNLNFTNSTITNDEKSFMALMANLFAHETFPKVVQNALVLNEDNSKLSVEGYEAILDQRSVMAKRSVAVNSIASIAALKAEGDAESAPFIYAVMKELGGNGMTTDQVRAYIGDNPSYYGQMEVVSKKLYQNPDFFTDLMDKPANVARKEVTVQAAELMQKRDIYHSILRSEATIATMLETALEEEQIFVTNQLRAALAESGALQ